MTAFSWANQKIKAREKALYRVTKLVKSNPDFRSKYPELAREVEKGNSLVESKKYVDKKVDRKLKYGEIPKPSIIIKRPNRVV